MARTVELRSDRPMKDGPAARSCRLGSEALALRPIGQIHGRLARAAAGPLLPSIASLRRSVADAASSRGSC